MTADLAAWLGERLDEDERLARWIVERGHWSGIYIESANAEEAAHVNRHDPARVLRDVEAKRRIIEALTIAERNVEEVRRTAPDYRLVREAEAARDALLHAVRLLALPYVDRPDYRVEEWAP